MNTEQINIAEVYRNFMVKIKAAKELFLKEITNIVSERDDKKVSFIKAKIDKMD